MISRWILPVLFFIAINSSARTIFVPEDYLNFQYAINVCVDGDSIVIAAGNYTGPFTISKSITVIGMGEETIIFTPNYSTYTIPLTIDTATDVVIKNIKISGFSYQPALYITNSQQIAISNTIFEGSHGESLIMNCGQGLPGILIDNSNEIILENVHSIGGRGGTGISPSGNVMRLCEGGSGIHLRNSSNVLIDSSELVGGQGAQYESWPPANDGYSIELEQSSDAIVNNSTLSNTYNVDSTSSLVLNNTIILGVNSEQKSLIFSLSQNYPNPFNPSTIIRFQLPISGFVTLKVYDFLGRELETLLNEEKADGYYEVEFNAKGLSSGLYFYQIKCGDFVQTKKMMLLK